MPDVDMASLLAELQSLRSAVAELKAQPRAPRVRQSQADLIPRVVAWLREHRARQPIKTADLFFELQAADEAFARAFNGLTPWASFAARCLYSNAAHEAGIRVSAGQVTLEEPDTAA